MEEGVRLCALKLTLGDVEECARGWCPFWEFGGAVLEAGCGLQRLGIDLSDTELASYVLGLRQALERAKSREEAERARREIDRLVPPDLSGA